MSHGGSVCGASATRREIDASRSSSLGSSDSRARRAECLLPIRPALLPVGLNVRAAMRM